MSVLPSLAYLSLATGASDDDDDGVSAFELFGDESPATSPRRPSKPRFLREPPRPRDRTTRPPQSMSAPTPLVIQEAGLEFTISRDPYRWTVMSLAENKYFESILEPVPPPLGAAASSESVERFKLFWKKSDHSLTFVRAVALTCTLKNGRQEPSQVALWVVDANKESLKNDTDGENFVFVFLRKKADHYLKVRFVSTNPWRPTGFQKDVFDRLELTVPQDAPNASPETPFVFFEASDEFGRTFSIMQYVKCEGNDLQQYVLMSKKREPSAQEPQGANGDMLLNPSKRKRLEDDIVKRWGRRNATKMQVSRSIAALLSISSVHRDLTLF